MPSQRKLPLRKRIPPWLWNKYLLTGAAFVVWMLLFDRNHIINQVQLRNKLSGYQKQIAFYERQIDSIKKQKDALLGDLATLEAFAREQYMMKRPEEDLIVIEDER